MKNKIWKFGALAIGIVTSSLTFADAAALQDLQNKLQGIKSYSAGFVQNTLDGKGETLQSIQGEMQVKKPGLLRWTTKGEYAQLVIADGRSVWVYDADLEQVTIKPMDDKLSETPGLLLGGDTSAIAEDFVVDMDDVEKDDVFVLTPKDSSQLFDALELKFSKDVLMEMIIRDASGQVTAISFTEAVNNPELASSLFVFNAPEGVDVIDTRP